MPQPPRSSTKDESVSFLTRIRALPIEQRAIAFILILGVLGAILGGVTTDVELRNCFQSWDCSAINPSEQRMNGIKTGAYAGIGAALILSLPAIYRELGGR